MNLETDSCSQRVECFQNSYERKAPTVNAMKRVVISAVVALANHSFAAAKEIMFSQSANSVAVYDYVEVSLRASAPIMGNRSRTLP